MPITELRHREAPTWHRDGQTDIYDPSSGTPLLPAEDLFPATDLLPSD